MAITSRRQSILFYHVECAGGKFDDFVKKSLKTNFFQQHFHQYEYEITLDVFEETPTYLCGHFVKTRMDDIDPKYNVKTFKTAKLPLKEDEGIPTGSVWLYHKRLKILFFQKTLMGISPSQFCEYFEKFADTGLMHLGFVLSEEGFRKLAGMDYVSKIEIAIKGLDQGYILKDTGSANAVIKKMKELEPNSVKIEISKGNRGEGLDVLSAKRFVTDFYRLIKSMGRNSDREGAEGHVIITGKDEDNEKERVDLLVSRYKRDIYFDVHSDSRLNTELYTKQRLKALKDLVNSAVNDLDKLYA